MGGAGRNRSSTRMRDPFAGFGFGPSLMDEFFGGGDPFMGGGGFGGSSSMQSFSSFSSGGGGRMISKSVSTSTYIGPDGRKVTRKETTVTNPDGSTQSNVEEYTEEPSGGGRRIDYGGDNRSSNRSSTRLTYDPYAGNDTRSNRSSVRMSSNYDSYQDNNNNLHAMDGSNLRRMSSKDPYSVPSSHSTSSARQSVRMNSSSTSSYQQQPTPSRHYEQEYYDTHSDLGMKYSSAGSSSSSSRPKSIRK